MKISKAAWTALLAQNRVHRLDIDGCSFASLHMIHKYNIDLVTSNRHPLSKIQNPLYATDKTHAKPSRNTPDGYTKQRSLSFDNFHFLVFLYAMLPLPAISAMRVDHVHIR